MPDKKGRADLSDMMSSLSRLPQAPTLKWRSEDSIDAHEQGNVQRHAEVLARFDTLIEKMNELIELIASHQTRIN